MKKDIPLERSITNAIIAELKRRKVFALKIHGG